MSDLITIAQTQTMTSKDMAEVTEKRHDSVKRTIDTLAENGVISQPQIVDGPKSANGVVEKIYLIGKRDSYVVVAQLSPEFTARLVDRWQELEGATADPMRVLADPAAMRSLLLGYTEKVIALESKVAEQAPKAQALDRIATASDGSFSLREAAKVLQLREKDFLHLLHHKGWTYRHPMGNRWLAHATTLRQGYMEHKTTEGDKEDGTGRWLSQQARITAKGMARLAVLAGVEMCANEPGHSLAA